MMPDQLAPEASEWYAFPLPGRPRWVGGSITETFVKGVVTICQRMTTEGVTVTLFPEVYAQWRREQDEQPDTWPTLWGDLPVAEGPKNAVWVPLAWLPRGRLAVPGRGSVSRW